MDSKQGESVVDKGKNAVDSAGTKADGSHAKMTSDGKTDSIVPEGIQKAVPEKLERALPDSIHNTGDHQ